MFVFAQMFCDEYFVQKTFSFRMLHLMKRESHQWDILTSNSNGKVYFLYWLLQTSSTHFFSRKFIKHSFFVLPRCFVGMSLKIDWINSRFDEKWLATKKNHLEIWINDIKLSSTSNKTKDEFCFLCLPSCQGLSNLLQRYQANKLNVKG